MKLIQRFNVLSVKNLDTLLHIAPKGLNPHKRTSLNASTAVVMAICQEIALVETAILVEEGDLADMDVVVEDVVVVEDIKLMKFRIVQTL